MKINLNYIHDSLKKFFSYNLVPYNIFKVNFFEFYSAMYSSACDFLIFMHHTTWVVMLVVTTGSHCFRKVDEPRRCGGNYIRMM